MRINISTACVLTPSFSSFFVTSRLSSGKLQWIFKNFLADKAIIISTSFMVLFQTTLRWLWSHFFAVHFFFLIFFDNGYNLHLLVWNTENHYSGVVEMQRHIIDKLMRRDGGGQELWSQKKWRRRRGALGSEWQCWYMFGSRLNWDLSGS